MSENATIAPRDWWVRVVHIWWLRPWNTNPLMRASDRIEAAVRIIVVAAVLTAVPVAGALGTAAYTADAARIRAERETRTVVTAVVTEQPARTSEHDVQAAVQWLANGRSGAATVSVPRLARSGDRIAVWLGPDGAPTSRPRDPAAAPMTGIGVGVVLLVGVCFCGGCLVQGTAWLLDRRRSVRCDRQWRQLTRSINEDRQ
ncbi:hypothetical protein [Nocardia sp. NPDC051463]|uniref:Rv1733c family protein n=1 Tax=Nocardia sp. NPDC051463 TaxID=3154845 RepID=UPI003443CC8A